MKTMLTKKDVGVILVCLFVLMMTLGAVGNKNRIAARDAVCRSNLRLLYEVGVSFAEDNDDRFLSYGSGLWMGCIEDYTDRLNRINICPMTRYPDDIYISSRWGTSWDTWVWSSGLTEPAIGSYGFNGWMYYYDIDKIYWGQYNWIESTANMIAYPFPNYTVIDSPSLVPMFFDAIWVDAWPKHTDTVPVNFDLTQVIRDTGTDSPVNNHIRRAVINRHYGKSNLGFVDGHVGSVDLGRLWGLKWHREFELYDGVMTRVDGSPIYPGY